MRRISPNQVGVLSLVWGVLTATTVLMVGGCGTSRWSDTARTATEQLLLSDAIDRAVGRMNFSALAGKTVYVDDSPIRGMTDAAYLSSCVRQHLLASGAILKESKDQATYILELRAGAIGTDRHDVTYGIPAIPVPNVAPGTVANVPHQLPEIPVAKKTHQRGVAKIAAFAYNRETGRPVWQSGVIPVETNVRALWLLGIGPIVNSRAGNRLLLAGDPLPVPPVHLPLGHLIGRPKEEFTPPSLTREAFFSDAPPSPPEPTPLATSEGPSQPEPLPGSVSTSPRMEFSAEHAAEEKTRPEAESAAVPKGSGHALSDPAGGGQALAESQASAASDGDSTIPSSPDSPSDDRPQVDPRLLVPHQELVVPTGAERARHATDLADALIDLLSSTEANSAGVDYAGLRDFPSSRPSFPAALWIQLPPSPGGNETRPVPHGDLRVPPVDEGALRRFSEWENTVPVLSGSSHSNHR